MAPRNVDDPEQVNAFLKVIGGTEHQEVSDVDETNDSPKNDSDVEGPVNGSASASAAASPSHGIRAPPSTPATRAVVATNIAHLEPVPEDGADVLLNQDVAQDAKSKLITSCWAPKPSASSYTTSQPARKILTPKSANTLANKSSITRTSMTATQLFRLKELRAMGDGKTLEDNVLGKFRADHTSQIGTTVIPNQSEKAQYSSFDANQVHGQSSPTASSSSSIFDTGPNSGLERLVKSNGPATEITTKLSPIANSFDFMSNQSTNVQAATMDMSPEDKSKVGNANDSDDLDQAREDLMNKISNLSVTEYDENEIITKYVAKEEHREVMTHFSSWGTPLARDKPKSRVRKVILTGLPPRADYTLVQSLVHGGSIETISLVGPTKSATTSIAYVTFTTANAADTYYERYPNGLDFNFQGKKYTAVVGKGKDVDVLSGLMEGYLECGGSRVVRVTGADEDWGMRALYKIAEGKGRQVENIIDTYRNETRNIVFRFTSIREAVQFKSQLVRDVDWELCDINFAPDPCESAKGIHLD